MNEILACFLAALGGYLLGTSNMAIYLAKAKHVDLSKGSGNPGTSNAMILMGWKAGVLTGLHDIGKGMLAVYLAKWLLPALPYAAPIAGAACVLGHMYPFYRRFRGGKGFATYLGVIGGLNFGFAWILGAVIILLVLLTDYIVVGTLTTMIVYPVFCVIQHQIVPAVLMGLLSLIIIWKHRENIVRILNGTEIGLRSASRGDHRQKQPAAGTETEESE